MKSPKKPSSVSTYGEDINLYLANELPGVKKLNPLEGYKLQDVNVKPDPDAEEDLKADTKIKLPSKTIFLNAQSAPYFRFPEPGNPYRFLFVNDPTLIEEKG
jgi:hypothetical protein